jgi:mannose-6-phosphate isomerase-like protein (cupin superfamily)
MKHFNIKNFDRGWIIGNFDNSVLKTEDFELGIKNYKSGEFNPNHLHKLSKEINFIISGIVKFNEEYFSAGDVVVVEENECSFFECIEDCCIVVARNKSISTDKYEC